MKLDKLELKTLKYFKQYRDSCDFQNISGRINNLIQFLAYTKQEMGKNPYNLDAFAEIMKKSMFQFKQELVFFEDFIDDYENNHKPIKNKIL